MSDLNTANSKRAQNSQRIKMVATLGMLIAIAYVVMWICKPIPKVANILQFDFKDAIIVIGGLLYGPFAAAASALLVSFLEMITASGTGPIGMLMNFVSTASFCCTAAFIYKRRRSQLGAIVGLASSVVAMVAVMLLWNYVVTPIYQNVPRNVVAAMLPTVFLPFNLVKGGLNMAATLLLYKPVVVALRKASLVQPSEQKKGKFSLSFLLFALFLLATFILLLLALLEII